MLQIDFINVGYGDALLVREDGAFSMLIDCGTPEPGASDPDSMRITAAAFLRETGVTHLDVLLLTHLHIDHIGTLPEIVRQTNVGALWTTYLPDPALWQADDRTLSPLQRGMREFLSALTTLGQKHTVMKRLEAPERIPLTDALTVEIDFARQYLPARQHIVLDAALSGRPNPRELQLQRRYMNVTCPLLTLIYHGRRIVLPADVYGHFWHERPLLPCYLLKAPHHGCAYSVTEPLLAALRPEIIVVSVSNDDTRDRPCPSSIAMMQRYTGQVRFTDAVSIGNLVEPPHKAFTVTIP